MTAPLPWPLPVLPRVDLVRPRDLAALLASVGEGRTPLAGGTDLLVRLAHGGVEPPPLALTTAVPELGDLVADDACIRLGSAVTHGAVAGHPLLRSRAPALAEAAAVVGSVQIRNVATVVGNVCNASPAADTVPALVAHDAEVELVAVDGASRTLAAERFLLAAGRTALAVREIVRSIALRPLAGREGSAYRRFTARASMDLAFVGVAARVALAADGTVAAARVVLGAVGPTVLVADAAAEALVGRLPSGDVLAAAGDAAARVARPIDDLRAGADYRRRLVAVLTGDVLRLALERAGSAP